MSANGERFSLDYIGLAIVAVVLLAVVGVSLLRWQNPAASAVGSIQNDGAAGGQALALLLQNLGYEVQIPPGPTLFPQPDDDVWFLLAPTGEFDLVELSALDRWVRAGGVLMLVPAADSDAGVLSYFDLALRRLWLRENEASLRLPTLNWPMVGTVTLRATHRLRLACGRAAVHIGDCQRPFLISFGRGQGQVVVLSSFYPLSNAGLENGRHVQLVENLLRLYAEPGASVRFDELHRRPAGFWLWRTPGGWALILMVLMSVGYGWGRNRPFGRPRPVLRARHSERRQTTSFINQIAAAEKELDETTQEIRRHYWHRLKRRLGRRYAIDPRQPDEQFLAACRDYLDDAQLGQLIHLMVAMAHPMTDLDLQQWTSSIISFGKED